MTAGRQVDFSTKIDLERQFKTILHGGRQLQLTWDRMTMMMASSLRIDGLQQQKILHKRRENLERLLDSNSKADNSNF